MSIKNSRFSNVIGKLTAIIVALISLAVVVPTSTVFAETTLWPIQAIDTMKVSRDKARDGISNATIQKEIDQIKSLGANYIAVDTPYDEEFVPLLARWVDLAHQSGLRVWFRGNFSNWEGWFGYPKNMTPEQHLQKNKEFILSHSDLFEQGDIFDACPECENAGFWPQPQTDDAYNKYVRDQYDGVTQALRQINKNVGVTTGSIIGGRALDVVKMDTVRYSGNTVAVDHYIKTPAEMASLIDFFGTNGSKVVVSEFGAPIPDINGPMTPQQQADYVDQIFNVLYTKKKTVIGVNYWVLSGGTTPIINPNGTERPVADIIRKYFIPAIVLGSVTEQDKSAKPIANVIVSDIESGESTLTNTNGQFTVVLPAGERHLKFEKGGYATQESTVSGISGQIATQSVSLKSSPIPIFSRFFDWIQSLAAH